MPDSADERFEAFYTQSFPRVVRELRRSVGADAEDVAQEALLVARGRWDGVSTLDRPDAWVRRVALRIGARRARREAERGAREAAVVAPATAPPPDLDLVAAMLDLPDRHAAAIRLHYLADSPIAEVAEMLGCTEGAAKVLLLRARRLLAEHLVGMTGRWVSERTWTVDALVRHLRSAGWASQVQAVVDGDMQGRGGTYVLTVLNGSYELRRDDGARFDHGLSRVDGDAFEMAPILNRGRARYRARVDGRRLSLRFEDATIPPFLGMPESAWAGMFFDVADFVRADPVPRR